MTFFLTFVAPIQWLARRLGWRVQHWIQGFFCRTMCGVIGIEVSAQGALPASGPRLVIANHVSWTDIIALASLYPLVFLAKQEVAGWPALGYLARLQGTIFVERGNRRAIPEVNERIANRLRQGSDVVVFAEGTSSDGSSVLKFNASHFAMLRAFAEEEAHSARPFAVSIAPVAIAYSAPNERSLEGAAPYDAGWYGDMDFVSHLWDLMKRGARCHILFGPAIDSGRLPDRKALAAATEESVRTLLINAYASGGASVKIANTHSGP
jgi:1-acyl-sn-glycerol-3-phosphate acyltransferase